MNIEGRSVLTIRTATGHTNRSKNTIATESYRVIGALAVMGDCVIGTSCVIGASAVIGDSVIGPVMGDCVIGTSCVIGDCVIGTSCVMGDSVIGTSCVIGASAVIGPVIGAAVAPPVKAIPSATNPRRIPSVRVFIVITA